MSRVPETVRATVGAIVLLLAAGGGSAAVGARLEYAPGVLGSRRVETVMAPALRSPGDSIALRAALGTLLSELQNLGYLDARLSAAWGAPPARPVETIPSTLRLDVQEGPRYRWQSMDLHTPSAAESARFTSTWSLTPGAWASPKALSEAVDRAVREAADRGFPYAELGVSAFEWDSSGARVRLTGALGPAVTVSRIQFVGLTVTRARLAEKVAGSLIGTPFDRAAAEAGRDRLAQLGLFRRVTFEGLEGEADWSRAALVYRVEEPRYNRFEGAVGLQGDDRGASGGPGGSRVVGLARLDLDNLAGTARAVGLRWESRGGGIQMFGARYAEPLLLGAPLRGEVAIDQHVQDTLYTRTRWGGRLQFALSGHEKLEAGYEQERVVQPAGIVEEASLQNTVFALEREGRDQPLDPRLGTRVRVAAGQTFKSETLRPAGRRSARASTVEGVAEWHRPLRRGTGLAIALSGAARFSSERVLPVFERYSLGGAASLRGHDEEAFRVDRYGLSRLEWRWFLGEGHQRIGLFWDHAWMATRVPVEMGGDRLDLRHRDGVGFGLRLDAGGSVIGVDYGLEPGRAPLEGKVHLQLISLF